MKTIKFMCAALVAAMTLAGCQKETQAGKNNGPQQPKSITISLSNVQVPAKSASTNVMDGTTAVVNNFQVFLTDGSQFFAGLNQDGTPARHYINVTDPSTDLTQTFHFVDPLVTQVIIMANVGSEQSFASVTDLKKFSVEIADQQDDKVGNLILFGEDTNLEVDGDHSGLHPTTEVYKAKVEIAPLIARIEVVNFSTKFSQNSVYKSVTVNKLAFNDYYRAYTIGNGIANQARINQDINESTVYDYLNGLTGIHWYYDNLDMNTATPAIEPITMAKTSAVEHTVEAGITHRYAYHFFPSATATTGDAEGYPQLVVGATVVDNQDRQSEQYLATESFTGAGFSGFEPGVIYRISFSFDDEDLEHQLKCVDVQVTVKEWTVITLTPNL